MPSSKFSNIWRTRFDQSSSVHPRFRIQGGYPERDGGRRTKDERMNERTKEILVSNLGCSLRHCTSLHCPEFYFAAMQCITLNCPALKNNTLLWNNYKIKKKHYTTMKWNPPESPELHFSSSLCLAAQQYRRKWEEGSRAWILCYTPLHYSILPCTTLHCTTLHYTALHYTRL